MEPLLLTLPEVGRDLRVSLRTVHRLIASRALVAVKVGRLVRIRRSDLLDFLDAKPPIPDNLHCAGPGVRNREENVCHTVAKTVPFGGRPSPTPADKELDALLERPTARRQTHSKRNGNSKRSELRSGTSSHHDPLEI